MHDPPCKQVRVSTIFPFIQYIITGCPPVDPAQVDLEDSIAEVEAETEATEDEAEIAEVESREGLQEYSHSKLRII